MAETYDVGDRVVVWAQFRDRAGVATDPTTVTLVIRKPGAAEAEAITTGWSHVADSGYYEYELPVDVEGIWYGEWRGTGAVSATQPFSFRVRRSRVGAIPTP